MKITPVLQSVSICFLIGLFATYGSATEPSSSSPAEIATSFLRHLDKAEVDAAITAWAGKAVNERLRKRVEQMSVKIGRLGGIQTMKTPEVEKRPRNLRSHEVVVIVVFRGKNLAFASFSFQEENGELKISNLRSEQVWGGTTALFEEEGH